LHRFLGAASQLFMNSLGSPAALNRRRLGASGFLSDGLCSLAFRGASLFSGYVYAGGNFVDPKVDGWFVSEDLGAVDGRTLEVHGRAGEFVKIGGESVDLGRLDRILRDIAGDDAAIVAVPDERLGHAIHLASTVDARAMVEAFNARVMPYERIRDVHRVDSIPRSPLGKVLRHVILSRIDGEGSP